MCADYLQPYINISVVSDRKYGIKILVHGIVHYYIFIRYFVCYPFIN
jgi:hypothetical protein